MSTTTTSPELTLERVQNAVDATDTILAESARSAADFAKEKTLTRLGAEIAKALG